MRSQHRPIIGSPLLCGTLALLAALSLVLLTGCPLAPAVPATDSGATDGGTSAGGDGGMSDGAGGGSSAGDNGGSDADGSGAGGASDGDGTGGAGGGSDAGTTDGAGTDSGDGDQTNSDGDTTTGSAPMSIGALVIAQTGTAVPDQAGATFTYFSNPVLDGGGRVAFWAGYQGGQGRNGLYVWDSGNLTRVVDDSAAEFSGNNSDIRWDQSKAPPLAWGTNGRLIFAAYIDGSALPNGLYRWRASDGDILRLADDDKLRVLFPNAETFLGQMSHSGLSDNGIVIFSNRYTALNEEGNIIAFRNVGVFTTNGLAVTPVVAKQLSQPGDVPDQWEHSSFDDAGLLTSLNPAGDMLLQAKYTMAPGDRGVYLYTGGSLYRVVDNAPDRSFPGLPAGTRIGQEGTPYDAIAMGPGLRVAIDTKLVADGSARDAVIMWSGSQWYELSGTGGATTDLISGINNAGQVVFLAAGQPYLGNESGSTALASSLPAELQGVSLQWENFSGAINNNGRALLRFKRSGSDAGGLVFWTGERLLLVADAAGDRPEPQADVIFPTERPASDEVDRAGVVTYLPEMDRPGRSGALNDRDEMVFRVGSLGADGKENTGDDYQALYLARGQ